MRISKTSLMMLAVGSLLLCASIATAQQPSPEGIVQLGRRTQIRPAAHCDAGQCLPGKTCDGYDNGCGCGNNCGCGNGRGCGNGNCPHCAAGVNGGACGYGCNPHYNHCGLGCLLNKANPYHTCTFPPDHGWAAPAQRPIWPVSAAYRRNFPARWTGEDLGIDPSFRYPMVSMPTDTTQLGFYYQHTPYWRSRQNMIPPVPHPAEWHTPDFGVVFTGYEHAGYGCPSGTVLHHGGSLYSTPAAGPAQDAGPQGAPVPMMESNPAAPYSPAPGAPVNPQMVPPAPEEAAPAPPTETSTIKSAGFPQLIPVPRQ